MLKIQDILSLSKWLPIFAGAKDIHSNYFWASSLTAKLLGYNKPEELYGKTDLNIKCSSRFAEYYMQCDQETMRTKNSQIYTEKCYWLDVGEVEVVCTKTPIVDEENNIAGVYFQCFPTSNLGLINLTKQLEKQLSFEKSEIKPEDETISNENKIYLTPRESEVLFHTLHGRTAKAIGRCLDLSFKTIEAHIANIKIKFNCSSRQQLIEKSISEGYLSVSSKAKAVKDISG